MARRITSEDLVLNLILNADSVDKGSHKLLNALYKLDRETRDLQNQLTALQVKMKGLDKSSAGYSAEVKKINAEMKSLREQIRANHAQMNEWRREIGISGLTINQLRSYLTVLKIELNNATDPATLKRLRNEMKMVQNQIERMTTGMTRMGQAFRNMGTFANKFGTITAWVTLIVFGLSRAVNSLTKNMRELDRLYSQVMKTTELTRTEVRKLKEEFDELSKSEEFRTPTATRDLLKIAEIAGRLGIRGVENIRDFTLAVDKLQVSLGSQLKGSVEDTAEQVGKLVNVFGLVGEDGLTHSEALLRMGSLLNELGKSSEASAGNLLTFLTRMGGVGSMAGITADKLGGIAATLDATGVSAERGSTAMVKLIVGLGQHVEKFSRLLGITAEEYSEWVKKDANAVLLELLELSSRGEKSIIDVVQSMGDMEVSGIRVAEVFGKLTENLDMVRRQQNIAATAFESSASVMNEYYIISRDWDALMAIQGKRLRTYADDFSKTLTPSVYKAYRAFIDLLYGVRDAGRWIAEHTGLVWALTGAWTAFKSARIARAINDTGKALWRWLGDIKRATAAAWANNAAVVAMRGAYSAAGGGVKGFTASLRALWAVMVSNPLTAFIALTGMTASAFFLLKTRTDEVKAAMNDMNAEMITQRNSLRKLFDAAMKTSEGTDARANAIKIINEAYRKYLPNLLSEKATQEELRAAYEAANKELTKQIAIKFQNERYDEILRKKAEQRTKKQERMLGHIKTRDGAYTYGQAMFEAEEVVDRLAKMTDQTAFRTVLNNFLKKWDIDAGATRRAFIEMIELRREELRIEKEFEDLIAGYVGAGDAAGIVKGEGKAKDTPGAMLTEEGFKIAKQQAELMRDEQRLALMQLGLDKEEYRKRELKLEEQFLRKMVELTVQKYTNMNGAVIGGDKEILDAQIALQQNLIAQQEDGGKKMIAKVKEDLLEVEVILLEMLERREITQQQYDILLLQMQEDYYAQQIAKGKAAGEEVLEWEKKWYEARIKERQLFEKQMDMISKAVSAALHPDEEATVKEDDDLVKNLIARRKRIRQFMGVERDAEWEKEFAVFETENFEGQLLQLQEWYNEGILNHEEYERRKTDITREETNNRLRLTGQVMDSINGLLSAQGNLFAAQKDAELKKAGDNERKKFAIQRKYAEKEKMVATGQAIISGALAIMRILEAKATGNALADAIIKPILIGATVATTGVQLAAIKAQQFAKGKYPVVGADDGKTYNAEFVGSPKTGIYKKPSLGLFAEKPEMVIDYPTLKNIQMNSPALIDAIMMHRRGPGVVNAGAGGAVPQYADGSYPAGGYAVMPQEVVDLLNETKTALQEIKNLRVVAAIETIERERGRYIEIMQNTGL